MELDDYSRFYQTDELLYDGVETFDKWNPPDFLKERPDDSFIEKYTVTSAVAGRPDTIANLLYGSPLLDWVLIAFNKVKDPLNWPMAGDVIEYPSEILVLPSI